MLGGRKSRALVRAVVLAGAAALVCGAGGAHGTAGATASCRWRVSPQPLVGGHFDGAAAVAQDDAWAVGTSQGQAAILHWNGRGWKRHATGVAGALYEVAASSRRNAWTVGANGDAPLALRWNGRAWRRFAVPRPAAAARARLSDVAVVSAREAWAVGSSYTAHDSPTPLVVRWDGVRWRTVRLPGKWEPFGIAARTASDVWVVGRPPLDGGPKIVHWDGKQWRASRVPRVGERGLLADVVALSARDVWAVGSADDGGERALVLHWNGRSWREARAPRNAGFEELWAVTARSPHEVWAVGTRDASERVVPAVDRFDGVRWRRAAGLPGTGPDGGALSGAAPAGTSSLWAVGGAIKADSPLILRYACT